ncbi:MAG: hypothetical protein M3Z07_00395 [Candidatus Eremiobacteraeota bacterium]|nr:hypothetical protein [Candidatus Eremiobacteraeota bacterium]
MSNGFGEAAIAERIAADLCDVGAFSCDHLALVSGSARGQHLTDVGPRKQMPSGGLIAMGNARNIVRDIAAGLLGHTWKQLRFARSARGKYAAAVAVGDVYALLVALRAGAPAVYVGTAKSVHVAHYGRMESRVLRRARAVFVRDEDTARALRAQNVHAEAPGNVIVDLFADALPCEEKYEPQLALFPGSRQTAYRDAVFLCSVVRELSRTRESLGAHLSVSPSLDAQTFARALACDGWEVQVEGLETSVPFTLYDGARAVVTAWSGPLGAMLPRAKIVLGQAGTANEAASAAGVPVVAFEPPGKKKTSWYRMRQARLLGDGLLVVRGGKAEAVSAVGALLDDEARRSRMGAAGRARMGGTGGARAIAGRIAAVARAGA